VRYFGKSTSGAHGGSALSAASSRQQGTSATARVGDNAPRAASARGRIGRVTKGKVEVAVQVAMRLIVAKLRNQQFFSLWN